MIVYVWARCSASSLEPIGGLRNVLWVNVTTTTSTEATRRKINVPTMIIVILRWRLACSKLRSSSTIFCASFTTVFRGRTESFLRVELALRTFVLLLELPLLPFPGHFFFFFWITFNPLLGPIITQLHRIKFGINNTIDDKCITDIFYFI